MSVQLTQGFTTTNTAMIPAGMGNGNWILLAPYGEHPHERGMQVFTPEDAAAVSADFDARPLWVKFFGLPWYIGHPDHPAFKERYKDTRAYGRITLLRAADKGLEGFVKFSRAGREIVDERAFHGHSVNWLCRLDNRGRYRPAALKSVGWTNENNIPVPPILVANEEREDPASPEATPGQAQNTPGLEDGQQTNTMHTKIRDQLILAGLLQPGETDIEAETAALQALFDGFTARGQTISELQGEVNDLRSKLETAETELGNERQAKADAKEALAAAAVTKSIVEGEKDTAFANERAARAKADVAVLVSERRLAQAGAVAAVEELANSVDYDGTLATYKSRGPMKTAEAARTATLGSRSPQLKEAEQGLRLQLANEISKKENVPFDVAWDRLKRRRKDLFEKVG